MDRGITFASRDQPVNRDPARLNVSFTPTPDLTRCPKLRWLLEQACDYEALDITKDVAALREWRELSGGVGVPVFAHGKEIAIGFNAGRYRMMVDGAGHCSEVKEV